MKQNDEIEDLFQSNFDDFSVEPPQSVKSAIDDKLFNTRKGFKGFWLFLSAFIFIVSIIGFSIYNSFSDTKLAATKNIETLKNKSFQVNQSPKDDSTFLEGKSKNEKEDKTEKSSLNSSIPAEKSATSKNAINEKTAEIPTAEKGDFSDNAKISKKASVKNNKRRKSLALKNSDSSNGLSTSFKKENREKSGQIFSKGNTSDNIGTNESNTGNLVGNNENITSNNTSAVEKSSSETIINKSENISNSQEVSVNKSDEDSLKISKMNALIDTNNTVVENKKDSTQVNALSPKPNLSIWLISMHSGTSFASNRLSQSTMKNNEKNAFFMNIEASKLLKNNFSLSSGFQFNKYSNEFNSTIIFADSVISSIDTTFIISPVDSSIILDTIVNVHYSKNITKVDERQLYNQMSLSVPLYFGYSQKIKDHFYFDIDGGVLLSYQQAKLVSTNSNIPDPTIRNFGVKLCVRPQIRYQFDHFGISISSNFGYDLMPTLNWSGVTRKRFYSEFGIGIHYQF